jgi:DNA gyrase subunit B
MSVVAALSDWLEHTNHREDGAWVQRYEHGVPVTELAELPHAQGTGTTVRFRPDDQLVTAPSADPAWYAAFGWLNVETVIE